MSKTTLKDLHRAGARVAEARRHGGTQYQNARKEYEETLADFMFASGFGMASTHYPQLKKEDL